MISDKLTLLIHSCDKFSDLWDAHVRLLNANWPDRTIRTIILTDEPRRDLVFSDIEIVGAGSGKEITERIRHILPSITTEYVLVTLDDYFVCTPVDTSAIVRLVDIMEKEKLDYLRMFERPKGFRTPTSHKGIFMVDTSHGYQVNLYAGIWRKSFIEKTLGKDVLNAWEFEVALTERANKVRGRCAMSTGREFPILDVVRKGRILPLSWLYLKRHDLYHGPRKMMPLTSYVLLGIKTWGNRLVSKLPRPIYDSIKRMLVSMGMKSFSSSKK